MRLAMDLRSMPLRAGGFSLPLRTSLVGSDGRVATFSCASKAWYEDATGRIVEVAAGVPRQRPDLGTLIEEPRTNRLLWSRDLTNAAWVATSATVVRCHGVDGLAGTASTVTATAANGQSLQTISGLTSAARIGSAWIRRRTGSGTVYITNGATVEPVDVDGTWRRFFVARAAATSFVFGVRIAVVGDAVDFDFAQVEDGTFPTSPIWTEGTALARAADVLHISTTGWPITAGTVRLRYRAITGAGDDPCVLLDTRAAALSPGYILEVRAGGTVALVIGDGSTFPRVEAAHGGFEPGRLIEARWGVGSGRMTVGATTASGALISPTGSAAIGYLGRRVDGVADVYANGWIADLEVAA